MSAKLICDNLVAYSLQIGLLVGLAAFVPALLRLRIPGAKLAYWQILLAACLALPLVRPWRQQIIAASVDITTRVVAVAPDNSAPARSYSTAEIALAVLAGGAALRLAWLAVGLWRLRRYRRHSRPWACSGRCATLLSEDVASPVTFGFRRPVILLPARFPELDRRMQEAVLCHEMLHVERCDWLFTFTEEVIRAIFWFHPAIWWLLGEIQLAREQAVDRAVVERTQARDEYVDALLAIAGGGAQPDLAPAPLFLRRRHLKQRVVAILKEVRMSKTRWVSGLAAALGILVAAGWFVTTTFPLAAAPQVVNDAPGITVDVGGAALLHRTPVIYPEAARRSGIQGNIAVEVKLDASGNVSDARVLSGPDELRKAALLSVFQWHFANSARGSTHVVNVAFQLPAGEPRAGEPGREGGVIGGIVGGVPGGVREGVMGGVIGPPDEQARAMAESKARALQLQIENLRAQQQNTAESQARLVALQKAIEASRQAPERPTFVGRVVKSITVLGLSEQLKGELLAKLPVHEGDSLSMESLQRASQAVREFDEHLMLSTGMMGSNEATLTITTPGYVDDGTKRIKIGGAVQQTKLIQQPRPVYPPLAKAAGIEGAVKLLATIAKDGTVQRLEVISGHPLLVPAALESVRQWVYQTTLLNGNPVEVQTEIDVNFTLAK